MHIGFITDANIARLNWAQKNGFRSIGWNRFETSRTAPHEQHWRSFADQFAAEAKTRHIRISTIGALYQNPLDRAQSEFAGAVFLRAIEVAAHIGVTTVSGFPGAVIELETHPKGKNPVYKPFENFLPRLIEFWEPIAKGAADKGVRIAFEHCPMGPYHLPIMGFNMLAQPAMWERLFNETKCDNIGIAWDASHLMCKVTDPVTKIQRCAP